MNRLTTAVLSSVLAGVVCILIIDMTTSDYEKHNSLSASPSEQRYAALPVPGTPGTVSMSRRPAGQPAEEQGPSTADDENAPLPADTTLSAMVNGVRVTIGQDDLSNGSSFSLPALQEALQIAIDVELLIQNARFGGPYDKVQLKNSNTKGDDTPGFAEIASLAAFYHTANKFSGDRLLLELVGQVTEDDLRSYWEKNFHRYEQYSSDEAFQQMVEDIAREKFAQAMAEGKLNEALLNARVLVAGSPIPRDVLESCIGEKPNTMDLETPLLDYLHATLGNSAADILAATVAVGNSELRMGELIQQMASLADTSISAESLVQVDETPLGPETERAIISSMALLAASEKAREKGLSLSEESESEQRQRLLDLYTNSPPEVLEKIRRQLRASANIQMETIQPSP